jgi:uncharacterized coiled-coil DUF342 family protein
MGKDTKSKIDQIKSEINALRNELNTINEEKRKWSDQSKEVYDSISAFFQSIREHKAKRNSLTNAVKRLKADRDKLNREISQKIENIKGLREEKTALQEKHNITEDPVKLRREIRGMETKIETEAMPFDKEKKLMRLINEKKKKLGEANVLGDVSKQIAEASKEIDKLKKEAKLKHDDIQAKADESQNHHEALLEVGKKLDAMKDDKEASYGKILEFQKKLDETQSKLEEKLLELKKLSSEIRQEKFEVAAKRKEEIEKILKEKELDVEEKIKQKKKLTTKDLLIFQRGK